METIISIPTAKKVLERCGWNIEVRCKEWGAEHSKRYILTKGTARKVFYSWNWRELVKLANSEQESK